MNNLINVYHLRDAYDHSLGYGINNNYTNLTEDTLKEILSKQERYVKSGDLGGYWVQVINYEVGGEYTIVDHIKTIPQKTRIELNVKAKRAGTTKRASIDQAINALHANLVAGGAPAIYAAPPVVANYDWVHDGVEIELEENN